MRTPHGERLFTVIGIPIDVTRYRPDAWLDDTPASGTAQRQGPWDRSTSVSDNVTMPLRRYSLTAPYHVQRSTFACRQVRTIYNSWRVDGCSTGFQRPLMDSQWWWVRLEKLEPAKPDFRVKSGVLRSAVGVRRPNVLCRQGYRGHCGRCGMPRAVVAT